MRTWYDSANCFYQKPVLYKNSTRSVLCGINSRYLQTMTISPDCRFVHKEKQSFYFITMLHHWFEKIQLASIKLSIENMSKSHFVRFVRIHKNFIQTEPIFENFQEFNSSLFILYGINRTATCLVKRLKTDS